MNQSMSLAPSRVSGRTIDVVGLFTAVVLGAVTTYFVVAGRTDKVEALVEEQRVLTERLNHLHQMSSALGRGEEALSLLRQGMDELDRRLPKELNLRDFYANLTEIASANDVSVRRILPGEALEKEGYVEVPVAFQASAEFEGFHAFLFHLTNGQGLIKLDKLALEVSDGRGLVDIEMTLTIYASQQETTANGP